MTLKNRNLMMKGLLVFSAAFLAASLATFFLAQFCGTLLPTPSDYRIPFSKYNFTAVVTSLFVMMLFVPSVFYFLTRYFNHTQASEVIYIWIFLIGVLCESVRIFIISLNLWQTYSNFLLVLSKIVLFGRVSTLISMFFAAIASDPSERKNIERNIFIIVAVSAVIAAIVPLNTNKIESTGMAVQGFKSSFQAISLVFIATTLAAFIMNSATKDTTESKKHTLAIAASYVAVILGFSLLSRCDTVPALFAGTLLLGFGMFFFLLYVHKLYLWQ